MDVKPISKYDLFDTYLTNLNRKLPFKFMEVTIDCHYYIEVYINTTKDDNHYKVAFELDAFSGKDAYTLQEVEEELIILTKKYQKTREIFNI